MPLHMPPPAPVTKTLSDLLTMIFRPLNNNVEGWQSLIGSGITVNNICPGVVDTPMVIDEVRAQVRRRVPTQNIIQPEEIGAMVNFLISDDARNINGTDMLIDGGATKLFSLFNNHEG